MQIYKFSICHPILRLRSDAPVLRREGDGYLSILSLGNFNCLQFVISSFAPSCFVIKFLYFKFTRHRRYSILLAKLLHFFDICKYLWVICKKICGLSFLKE